MTNLPLAPQHLEELVKGSAISPEVLARAGIYSENDPKACALLLGKPPRLWAEGHAPAWIVPYRIPFQRDPVLFRGKPAKPFEQKDRDGTIKLEKYAQPRKTGVHLYFGPSLVDGDALRDVARPLWITEGEKKCLSAESHGLCCIAVPGVTQWHLKGERKLHPYFAHVALEGREVFLCFDRDSLAKEQVRKQEIEFARALEAIGARVRIVRLPEDAPKLDDFFATHDANELGELIEDARKGGTLPPDTRGPSDEDWKAIWAEVRLDESERPVKDTDTITQILLRHPAWEGVLAYDARFERQVFLKQPPFRESVAPVKATAPRAVTDNDATRIADWLVSQRVLGWGLAPKTTQVEQAVAVVCERNRFDEVANYLKGLAWDGVPRLDTMAVQLFGAKDTPYTRAVVAKWMLSAVARARNPGCQVDHVLVLEGKQGVGKSTALRLLAGDAFFSDSVPEIPSRDAHEHCVGPWIIELAELDHVRKSEVTALKAFVSARAPRFRSAYGRRTIEHPRRCVFAGTTNDDAYLADSTGNRRFWPVECLRIDLEAISRDRDQLWAEALARLRVGDHWHITDAQVHDEAEREQEARRTVDPWFEVVGRYVHNRPEVTIQEILDHLGFDTAMKLEQRSSNRVASIIRELGWVRRQLRIGGRRVWRYYPRPIAPVTSVTSINGLSPVYENELVTTQTADFAGVSGASPVSPVSTINTGARARDAMHVHTNGLKSATEAETGDTGDSLEREYRSDTYAVTSMNGHTGDRGDHTGDTGDREEREREGEGRGTPGNNGSQGTNGHASANGARKWRL